MIALVAPGPRGQVNVEGARAITESWLHQLEGLDQSSLSDGLRVALCSKSYVPDAAEIIAVFFTSIDHFNPCLATYVKEVDMSDVIASQKTEDGFKVLQTLANAFNDAASLEVVIVDDNALGPQGIQSLKTLLKPGPLKVLSFCDNGLSGEAMTDLANIVVENGIASNLEKLHFFKNNSGDVGCTAFSQILDSCNPAVLKDLRFSGTRATFDGSRQIVEALKRLTDKGSVLERLDLRDNTFSKSNAPILATALANLPQLVYVNLGDCELMDEGLETVSYALLQCRLRHLDLNGNEITQTGISKDSAFGKLLSNNTLESLHLHDNEIGSQGAANIAKIFKHSSLSELTLATNSIGSNGAKKLLCLSNLRSLDLDSNSFSDECIRTLEETFADRLKPMEDNYYDSDIDDDVEEDSEEEEEEEEEEKEEEEEEEEEELEELTQTLSQLDLTQPTASQLYWMTK